MSAEPVDENDREARLDAVIAAYLEARDSNEHPDVDDWLARYPDLAPDLERYFRSEGLIDWLVTTTIPARPARGGWFGRYRLVRTIGRGSMGIVYEAEDSETGTRVALKVLPTFGVPDATERDRFDREAEIVARLDHPNIVPLLGFGEHAGFPYVAMPLIDGPNLRVVVRQLRRAAKGQDSVCYTVTLPGAGGDSATLASDSPRWRAVASIGLQAAHALGHAHDRHVLHRDVKPSNLLLGRDGSVYVTDFGLARSDEHPDLTETGDVMGTLRYMAPERFLRRWCDPRSDLYSLGLTLYELLTLRPAFDDLDRTHLIRAMIEETPPRPRSFAPDLPRDLETIALKLIAKEPTDRYQSAADLAADLQRLLDGRPITARRPNPARRLWSWARRHKLRAIGLVFVLCTVVGGLVAAFMFERMRGDMAKARAEIAQGDRDKAVRAAAESRYQSLIIQAEQGRTVPRGLDWSVHCLDTIREAAKLRRDLSLRDQAIATLTGLDVHRIHVFEDFGASSVAFDAGGNRLAMGGLEPADGQDARAKLWTLATDALQFSEHTGPGPVAFLADRTPVQLTAPFQGEVLVTDVTHRKTLARLPLPEGRTAGVLGISDDGRYVAAATTETVHVWDVMSGRRLRDLKQPSITSLAITPDGSLLATGDARGNVRVWTLSDASPEPLAEFRDTRAMILCLDFARDPRWSPPGLQGWLLAAGDSASSLIVYDVSSRAQRCKCVGVEFLTQAVAFSPDGSMLVSTGQITVFWDAASGRALLRVGGTNITGIAFSPDGTRLALSTRTRRNGVEVYALDQDRGLFALRGLAAPVAKITFSADATRAAALSHDFRVAVWDLKARRLLGVFNGPLGDTADNAALAFSDDGRRLAVSAGREAQLWDLTEGRRLWALTLPDGLVDQLAYPSADRLLSFRAEHDRESQPRVGRLRNLLGPEPLRPLTETPRYTGRVLDADCTPDGRYFAVDGTYVENSTAHRRVCVYDGFTGMEVLSMPLLAPPHNGCLTFDPSGSVLCVDVGGSQGRLHEIPSGRLRQVAVRQYTVALGLDARLRVSLETLPSTASRSTPTLRSDSERVLAHFGLDDVVLGLGTTFSRDGRLLAYGCADGAVVVCDLGTLKRRLEVLDLGW